MQQRQKFRRRNYFIKKEMQGRFIFRIFLYVVLGSMVFFIIFAAMASDSITIKYDYQEFKLGRTPSMLFDAALIAQWIFICTAGVLAAIVAMFITHTFAGPIYRFERTMDEMAKGNLSQTIKLRKNDEGRELADKINLLNDKLSIDISMIRELAGENEKRLNTHSLDTASINKAAEANKRILEATRGYITRSD